MDAKDIKKLEKHAPEFFPLERAAVSLRATIAALESAIKKAASAGADDDYLQWIREEIQVLNSKLNYLIQWKNEAREHVLGE